MSPTTDDLDRTLRTLDPASREVDSRSTRARSDLADILATDPSAPTDQPASRQRPGRGRRRVLVLAGTATAMTAGFLALPSVVGGDQAFATWTPTAAPLAGRDLDEASESCRDAQLDSASSADAGALRSARPALAETRGAWTTVLLVADGGFSALCVTDGSRRLFDDWIGSVGRPDVPAPGPGREVVATDLGSGTTSAGDLSLAAGTVDADVVSVGYDSAAHGQVQATVADGHFAFWLPGDELADAARDGVLLEVVRRDGSSAVVRVRL